MAQSPFIWGRNGRKLTPDQVARERDLVSAAQGRMGDTSPVGHWTQGATRVVDALGGVLRERRTDKAEEAGMAGADAFVQNDPVLSGLINGGGSGMPIEAPAPVGAGADEIRAGLIARGLPEHVADGFVMNFQDESGLNPGINETNPTVPGSRGGFGLAQWTGPRRRQLEEFAASRGANVADPNLQLDFLMTELQGPESKAAQQIFGAKDAGQAGAAIVNSFLRPAESHRRSREARYTGGGGMSPQGQPLPVTGGGSGVVAALAGAMSDPWVAKKYGPVIDALMGQQMNRGDMQYQQQLAQSDPGYQMGLEKSRLELDALRNPAAPKPIEVGGVLLDPTTYQPIFDSRTPAGGDGFTLSPGQQRFDAQGNPIAAAPGEAPPAPMTPAQRAEWGIPPEDARPYAMTPEGPKLIGGSGVTVNNNMGEDKFGEAFAKGDATTLGAVSDSGLAAQRNLGRIDQLEKLLASSPTGAAGAIAQAAGEWGINTEGLGPIQAAQALINSLVPEQRQPGSGPMSDADLALFKQSLPRIINQPGGNEVILNTMRAIAQYDSQGAQIVQDLRAGKIDRATAFQALKDRPNPMQGFKQPPAPAQSEPQADVVPQGVDPEDWKYMTPEQKAVFQ